MIFSSTDHYHAFDRGLKDAQLDPNNVGGKPWDTFFRGLPEVIGNEFIPQSAKGITREEVFRAASDPKVSTVVVAAAALAWGGMNMRYHKAFFEVASKGWLHVANKIRRGELNRADAFEAFRLLREEGKMPGVGPAYYTKLIYFLSRTAAAPHKPQGFILDQWTGCSLNLLAGAPIIHLNVSMSTKPPVKYVFTVSDANTAQAYEKFCCGVEELVSLCGHTEDEVDHALQRKGGWREYVREHRKP
ncbi:MAG: hypothetical protein ACMUJJ_01010 [Roseicyclus sp.]|uniref:8-oxoguanine DNA glycosylase OGG fold protein n=1 Tax=Roseicyclus sp. TaxID=1914329 RepID=UPI003A86FE2F